MPTDECMIATLTSKSALNVRERISKTTFERYQNLTLKTNVDKVLRNNNLQNTQEIENPGTDV